MPKIDYESAPIQVNLCCELPFWISAPSQSTNVHLDGCKIEIEIHNDLIGVYTTTSVERDGQNLAFVVPQADFPKWIQRDPFSKGPFHTRSLRTFLSISCYCHADAFEALRGDDLPRNNVATWYFKSLIAAQVPAVNRLVEIYLAQSHDPYAFKIDEWDIPLWYARGHDRIFRFIPLIQYPLSDKIPSTSSFGGIQIPKFRCELLADSADNELTPAMRLLLGAWRKFHQRKYADAIVEVVTAIEVVVDERLRKVWVEHGFTRPQINKMIESQSFWEKIRSYRMLTGERLPGPIVSLFPECNKVRLEDELATVRRLRNKIVHEGIESNVKRGPALRILETMSWLARCLSGITAYDLTLAKDYAFNVGEASRLPLPTICDEGRIMVFEPPFEGDFQDQMIHNVHSQLIVESLTGSSKDVDYAVHASLSWLGFLVREATYDEFADQNLVERFVVLHSGINWLVFIRRHFDDHSKDFLSKRLRKAATRLATRVHALVVIDSAVHKVAQSDKTFTFIQLKTLAKNACFARTIQLDSCEQRAAILSEGASYLPNAKLIGHDAKTFQEGKILSLHLKACEVIHSGNELVLELNEDFVSVIAEELQVNKKSYNSVTGPTRVGIKVDRRVSSKFRRANVYRIEVPRIECGQ